MIGVVILMTFEMVIAEHDSTFPSFAVICLLHIALIFLLSVLMVVGRRCVVESFFFPHYLSLEEAGRGSPGGR